MKIHFHVEIALIEKLLWFNARISVILLAIRISFKFYNIHTWLHIKFVNQSKLNSLKFRFYFLYLSSCVVFLFGFSFLCHRKGFPICGVIVNISRQTFSQNWLRNYIVYLFVSFFSLLFLSFHISFHCNGGCFFSIPCLSECLFSFNSISRYIMKITKSVFKDTSYLNNKSWTRNILFLVFQLVYYVCLCIAQNYSTNRTSWAFSEFCEIRIAV